MLPKRKSLQTERDPLTTSFVIAENNDFFRSTLVQILVKRDGLYTCAGEARDGKQALERIAETSPDVLILDLRMPRMDGFEVMDALRGKPLSPRILVLTMNHSEGMMQKAFEHGADGYCTKTSGMEALFEALDQVARGRRYVSPDLRGTGLKYCDS